MDVYAEQSLNNEKIEKNKKKTFILRILRYLCIAAIVVVTILAYFNFMGTQVSLWPIVFAIVSAILFIAPFVLIYFFLGRFIANSNLEYDYYLNGDLFRIVKVLNRQKRKKMLEIKISSIESVGRANSDSYERFSASKDVKKIIAICDFEKEDDLFYIYCNNEGVKQLIHIHPNEEMRNALRRSINRITIIDKSFNAPIVPAASKTETDSISKA